MEHHRIKELYLVNPVALSEQLILQDLHASKFNRYQDLTTDLANVRS